MPGLTAIRRMFCVSALTFTFWNAGLAQQADSPQTEPPGALPAAPQAATPPRPHLEHYTPQDYSKAAKPFPSLLAPYKARHVPEPNLTNTARLEQLLRDGKIYLSMDDAVALALENNLDLVLARYNLNIADTDLLRARAGSNILGVNTGVVQNTPGGGVGGAERHRWVWQRRNQRSRRRGRLGHEWSGEFHSRHRRAYSQFRSCSHRDLADGPRLQPV